MQNVEIYPIYPLPKQGDMPLFFGKNIQVAKNILTNDLFCVFSQKTFVFVENTCKMI